MLPRRARGILAPVAYLWVDQRPERARLEMGVEAIGACGSISGMSLRGTYKDRLHHAQMLTGHGGPGSPHYPSCEKVLPRPACGMLAPLACPSRAKVLPRRHFTR